MRTPKYGARRTLLAAAVPVGIVVSGALVWQSSYAAFTATTDNPANSWQTGTVVLTDNDGSAALFSETVLAPDMEGVRCIAVRYNGTIQTNQIRLFVNDDPTDPFSALDDRMNISIKQRDVTAAQRAGADCADPDAGGAGTAFTSGLGTDTFGTVADLADDVQDPDSGFQLQELKANHSDYGDGIVVDDDAATDSYVEYRIAWRLQDTLNDDPAEDSVPNRDNGAANAYMNARSTALFEWEVRSLSS